LVGLPIGIQNLREIRQSKGALLRRQDGHGRRPDRSPASTHFLSRPRRFGKSLLVDTLKELFEGNRALFEGLAAEPRWDWSRRHPVIRISFSDGVLRGRIELERRIRDQLRMAREDLGLRCQRPGSGRPARPTGRTDPPGPPRSRPARWRCWWTNTTNPSWTTWTPAIAAEMRDGLRSLYSVLKGSDAHLKFVFLTGVSKFSKVSLFSGLNNLQDLTLDPQFSALCGYTDADIDSVFAPELPGWTASRSAAGTTATTGAGRGCTTPSTCCCCFATGSSAPTGSRPARPPS
jgi:hypothetical protein